MNYSVRNEVIYSAEVLKSNLCDYNHACILVKSNITIIGQNVTQVACKNCAPFTKCITKIYETTIEDVEDLYLVMPMYNMLENSSSYSDTTGILSFYFKDETTDFNVDIANTLNISYMRLYY